MCDDDDVDDIDDENCRIVHENPVANLFGFPVHPLVQKMMMMSIFDLVSS